MCWIIITSVICLTLFLIWASADIGSNVYLKTLCKGKTTKKVVTLTFDDGPDKEMTPRVLDILKEYNIKATFFLIGKNVEKHPDIVKRMVAEGHIIANHTHSHQGTFPMSSSKQVNNELRNCDEAIMQATGKSPKLFRPPFGVTNPIIGNAVRKREYRTIGWSIRSLDTIKGRSRKEVRDKVVAKLHPGAIILLHDRCEKADELLREIISAGKEKGYDFVSLKEILNIKAYEN